MIFIISSHLCLLASYISCNPLVGSVTPVRSLFLLRFSTFRYSVLCSPYRNIIGVLPLVKVQYMNWMYVNRRKCRSIQIEPFTHDRH